MERWIDEIFSQHEKRKKVKDMCRTRWVERHEAFEVFIDLFMPITCCLEEIANSSPTDWNSETRSDAQSFFLAIFRFSFVVALVLTEKVLSYVRGLSVKLQGRYLDVVRAHKNIETVKSTLTKLRVDIENFHRKAYGEAILVCQTVGIEEATPRVTSRQQHRQNIPADNSSDYYKRTTTIPLLDHLISELNARFDADSSQLVSEFMQLLPSEIIKNPSEISKANFQSLLDFYEDDLPSSRSFECELNLWQNYWNSERCLTIAEGLDTPAKVLKHTDKDMYPNIYTLSVIMATLPVTSCECERSISMLRHIKSSLRSTMGQNRLNGLAMLYYNRHITLEPDEVVQEFSARHPRKLLLQ